MLKVAVGTDFYNKVYYALATIIKESSDLMLGFSCKWVDIVKAVENALGRMASVKRLVHFVSIKEYMKGGITVADTFNKVNHFVEETHWKTDKVFMHEDGKP